MITDAQGQRPRGRGAAVRGRHGWDRVRARRGSRRSSWRCSLPIRRPDTRRSPGSTEADARAGRGDISGAIFVYDQIAADSRLDPLYRDLGALLAAQRLIDRASAAEVNQRLAPLLAGHSPWRPLATELSAIAELRAGNVAAARGLFAELVSDPAAPLGLRQRAAELLLSLGGDSGSGACGRRPVGRLGRRRCRRLGRRGGREHGGMRRAASKGASRGAFALLGLCVLLGLERLRHRLGMV